MGVTQEDIAKVVGVHRGHVAHILNDPTFPANPETRDRVLRAAKDLGYDMSRVLNMRRRRPIRKETNLAVSIKVYLQTSNTVVSQGTATIANLNQNGALFSNFQLDNGAHFPFESFYFTFKIHEGDLEGIEGKSLPVRFCLETGSFALGVKFTDLDTAQKKRLYEYVTGDKRKWYNKQMRDDN